MNREKYFLFSLLFIFFIASFVFGQEGRGNARLKGFVFDKEGQPIKGAKIELQSLIHNLKKTVFSDEKGRWAFLGLGKTVVKITVTKEGYNPVIIPKLTVSAFTKKNKIQKIILTRIDDVSSIEKEDPKTLFEKGQKLYEEGKYEKALKVFYKIIEKNPNLFLIKMNIGNCYVKMKKYNKAVEEFNWVLEKLKEKTPDLKGNKNAASLYASIGEIYMEKGDYVKAKEYFTKSIEIEPTNHALAYNVAEILFNMSKIDEAIKYYKLAAKINPKWAKAYLKLGYCYVNKGDTKNAIKYFNEFLSLSKDKNPQDVSVVKEILKTLKRKNEN